MFIERKHRKWPYLMQDAFIQFQIGLSVFRHESGSHRNSQKSRETLLKESQVAQLPACM